MPALKPVSYQVLACIFERAGFKKTREEGSHLVYTKPGVMRPVVIPKYRSVPVFIIRNNLRSAGMSRDQYFDLLAKCR
jgi:predicted RNA binding protein YcfA (HicA-like mRNA interferase family)